MLWKAEDRSSNYALIASMIIHILAVAILAGYPVGKYIQKEGSALFVEWVKDVPEPELKRELPKEPIEMKFDPTRDPNMEGKKKTVRASPSEVTWVKRLSDRVLEKSVEINDADKKEEIPDIMTAARIRDAQSSLSGMVSTDAGPMDGRGQLGDRARVKGNGRGGRSGMSVLGLGGNGNGLAGDGPGGGGGGGLLDRLGLIDFINESKGPQKIIYLLDVSASMTMGSKLSLSIKSLKESMLQLADFDQFNIIAFHSRLQSLSPNPLSATIGNIEKAERFMDSFTPRKIENNVGTDILNALREALKMEPSIIVLITDIQPTRGEVDDDRIAEEVKKINKNTRIYGVGVEVWEPSPTGRMAKLLKMLTEQNGGQMRLAGSG